MDFILICIGIFSLKAAGELKLGFLIGVCPACFSFIGFLVPLSASIFLTTFAPVFMTASIAIILFSIYRVGGFKSLSVNREMNLRK